MRVVESANLFNKAFAFSKVENCHQYPIILDIQCSISLH